jgi:quinoprotein glucose dehydrogenase
MIRFLYLMLAIAMFGCSDRKDSHEWTEYLGGADRNHYSTLDLINRANVKDLKVAWEYHSRDSGQLQCNPIIVNGILYGMTARALPFALDAASGKEIWRVDDTTSTKGYATSRGVSYWQDGDDKRILYTKESWLYAVDAMSGKAIGSFGENGRVSLASGLGERATRRFVISNTPGTVYQDLIIMPLRLSEGNDAAPGYVQAFNIRSGKVEWVFKTIPHPGEPGYETWPEKTYMDSTVGAANNWAGMAVDRDRGIVYVPTGSAAFDFYGGNRKGQNLFANTLLALSAKDGKLIWHYQLVHHDILDRDPPAPPNLLTVTHNGKKIDAVAQVTKQGYIFLFDRETGKPLFPVEEIKVPASDVAGEEAWPTQPRPVKPEPYARQMVTPDDVNPYSNVEALRSKILASRSEGPFTPLSKKGTIIFPGLDGGAEWGGAAADPEGVLYLNSTEMAWLISLAENSAVGNSAIHPGEQVYAQYCSSCHGAERNGNPASGFPSLVDINNRFQRDHVLSVIGTGKGMMPAFKQLSSDQKKLLVAFLYGDKTEVKEDKVEAGTDQKTLPGYKISGYTKFLDENGYPGIKPPWGTLNAIDMNTGEYKWKKVFGEYPELMAKGIPQTGSESYGGPVVTAGGLLFIAGTKDSKFRAYDKNTGDILWETKLPAAGFATPATYTVDHKQYVVIACGGTKLGAPKGESYVAFALPE